MLIQDHGLAGATLQARCLPGAWSFFTVDPTNIQAILATQFHDFGLGQTRIASFDSLLGSGIVCLLHLV